MWWRVLLLIYAVIVIAILLFCLGVVAGIFKAAMEDEQNENNQNL